MLVYINNTITNFNNINSQTHKIITIAINQIKNLYTNVLFILKVLNKPSKTMAPNTLNHL